MDQTATPPLKYPPTPHGISTIIQPCIAFLNIVRILIIIIQANIEEKFEALHKKEEEMEELRKSLRERDRLIENINAVAVQHEDDAKVMAIIDAICSACDNSRIGGTSILRSGTSLFSAKYHVCTRYSRYTPIRSSDYASK